MSPEVTFEVWLPIMLNLVLLQNSLYPMRTSSTELFIANHLNNNEMVPLLEVWSRISSHFQLIVTTRT